MKPSLGGGGSGGWATVVGGLQELKINHDVWSRTLIKCSSISSAFLYGL